ncbi:tyrosine-type recombinase/integrase [Streptomyces buecherae]|uniref:tyrosine-type recombinase/integrase n=1 Tax=Streptomyces buecherae TaxID=2763006 RepID=UPI00164E0AE6|nr:site-specific integrase [Streptomyces buecherae]QNJ42042.1 tyrosine-type recombinase/integrase [Streptomyces buecherae]
MVAKKGNGNGGTPVKVKRVGRPDTWGVRTPLHVNAATGEPDRYWIGREYPTKTAAERALREWIADYEAGKVVARSDVTLGEWLDAWLAHHRGEETTLAGYEPKIRLHIKPYIGKLRLSEVTDESLNGLYKTLETKPCPTNKGKPLGAKSVRHVHTILSGALGAAVPKFIPVNPAATAKPPTGRQIRAQRPRYETLNDAETRAFLKDIWSPCKRRGCGLLHFCTRDAPLWTVYTATGVRRSEALGMMWHLIDWEECSIQLEWVVVEVKGKTVLRRLTKDGDDNARIYVDQSLMKVLRLQWERQQAWKERVGDLWDENDLVFARDGYMLKKGGGGISPGGPQDPGQVSDRWRTARERLHLPERFRLHDWRHSKITNDLDAGENPVEVSANARHHSPGYTMGQYGHRRATGARRLAAGSARRIGLGESE